MKILNDLRELELKETDPRRSALLRLAMFCVGITPSTVGRNPTADDGIELAKDLRLLAKKVDFVIAAYGEYADSVIGVDLGLFKDQLADALTGNAIYEIETNAAELEQAQREPDPDAQRDAMLERDWR